MRRISSVRSCIWAFVGLPFMAAHQFGNPGAMPIVQPRIVDERELLSSPPVAKEVGTPFTRHITAGGEGQVNRPGVTLAAGGPRAPLAECRQRLLPQCPLVGAEEQRR